MSLLNILFGLLLISAGICGQKIELEIPQNSTSCEKGFRANKDEYYITATIGPRSNDLWSSGWLPSLEFQVLPVGATDYIPLCEAVFSSNGLSCSVPSKDPCYCDQFDNSTSTFHVLAKYVAQVSHSLGTVRGRLVNNNNGSSFYSSTINKTLPEIYDVKDAVLTLTVNGVPADTTPVSCGLSFRANEENTVKLCCSKAAMPCYPRLAFNGIDVANKSISPCVEYTFTANETVNVTKWYSVCSLTDYTPSGFCVIQTKTPDKPSNLDLPLGLGLGSGSGLGFIVGIILGIYFWKKKLLCCKKQATGHDSAKGSEAPTHVDENIDLKTTGKEKKPSDGRQNKDQGNKNAGAIEHEGNQDTSR